MAQNLIITAHRGASGYAPENTLAAIEKALQIGVDRIEVDVQQTSDGVVVCLHDKTLDRTTNGDGAVKNLTWEELQLYNANKGFELAYGFERIPSLEEVFKRMDGKTRLVIEIKNGNRTYPGIVGNVAELIKKHGAQRWAIVHSFNDRALEYLHDNYPDIRIQKLFVRKFSWLPLMIDFGLHYASLSDYSYVEAFGVHKGNVTKSLVDRIHHMGKLIHVWTVNDENDMKELIELGVDGIITNYPDKLKALTDSK